MAAFIRYSRALAVALIALMCSGVVPASAGDNAQHPNLTPPSSPGVWFPYQQGWLGADGAYSVPLDRSRSLWVFGDTFVGPPEAKSRKQATGFIHNSIAISECPGRQHCLFHYYWSGMGSKSPGSMFIAGAHNWFWPMDGFIYNGTLYLALMEMHATGTGGPFGFAYTGVQLASVHNYTAPPSQWSVKYQLLNTGSAAIPGVSIVVHEGPNGNPDPSNPQGANYAYFFTLAGSNDAGTQHLALLRLPLGQLNHAARPGNSSWQYLKRNLSWGEWHDSETSLPGDNAVVLKPMATEMTVRYHSSTRQWIAVYPVGLAKSAHYSLSPSMTTGWGKSEDLYAYPEMRPLDPNYTPNVFCYAVKEHTELEAQGKIFLTYACNSAKESEIINNMGLYHPIVVIQSLPSQ